LSIYMREINQPNALFIFSLLLTIPLFVSDLLVAHHQEVEMHIGDNWYLLIISYQEARTMYRYSD
jgi:hypothetical protein